MEKKKLQLKKQIVSNLTIQEQSNVLGGEAMFSSKRNSTGFLCCDQDDNTTGFTDIVGCPPPDTTGPQTYTSTC